MGLVLGGASSSEDLALGVLLVVGTALAGGVSGRWDSAALERVPGRWWWALGAAAVAPALVGVLVGQGFPNDASALTTLAAAVGIWAAGTGALTYLIVRLLPRIASVSRGWALYLGVVLGLAAAFGANLLLMVASGTA